MSGSSAPGTRYSPVSGNRQQVPSSAVSSSVSAKRPISGVPVFSSASSSASRRISQPAGCSPTVPENSALRIGSGLPDASERHGMPLAVRIGATAAVAPVRSSSRESCAGRPAVTVSPGAGKKIRSYRAARIPAASRAKKLPEEGGRNSSGISEDGMEKSGCFPAAGRRRTEMPVSCVIIFQSFDPGPGPELNARGNGLRRLADRRIFRQEQAMGLVVDAGRIVERSRHHLQRPGETDVVAGLIAP